MGMFDVLLSSVVWNNSYEDIPQGSDSPSEGDDAIREVKESVRERFEKEHKMNLTAGAVGPDGWHKRGSGIPYYQADAPTTRPDDVTALNANDSGRRWVRSTDRREYVYVHPDWLQVTSGTTTENTWEGPQTFDDDAIFNDNATFNADIVVNGTFNGGTPITEEDVNLLDAENVKLTGNQTVGGIKTFSSIPVLPASNPTSINQAVRKEYVDEIVNWNVNSLYTKSSTSNILYTLPGTSGESWSYSRIAAGRSSSSGTITITIRLPSSGTYECLATVHGGSSISATSITASTFISESCLSTYLDYARTIIYSSVAGSTNILSTVGGGDSDNYASLISVLYRKIS